MSVRIRVALVFLIVLFLTSLLMFSVRLSPGVYSKTMPVIGTVGTIRIVCKNSEDARKASLQAFRKIEELGARMNRRNVSSDIGLLNENGFKDYISVDKKVFEVIMKGVALSEETNGAFEIAILPLINVWNKAGANGVVPDSGAIKSALDKCGSRFINLAADERVKFSKEGTGVDLGGIAKGFLIDQAAQVISSSGFDNFIVEIGGDMYVSGVKPGGRKWSIGIKHPRKKSNIIDKIAMSDSAVATSGDYERYFKRGSERYHHILDPRTGLPARVAISVTVVAPDAATADALATAAFVMGPDAGLDFIEKSPDVEGFIVSEKDGAFNVVETTGFNDLRK